ncbi:MAG: hypothetical protein JWR16_3041 [Nevskia sp.]|nr:hypothetical protein [Nevskia sp.]
MQRNQRRWWLWGISALAAFAVLAALISSLFQLAVEAVPGYRQKVEQRVSQASGYPVAIGSMALAWRGLQPTLDLRDVSVLPHAAAANSVSSAAPLLHLGELRLGFSLWRLLRTDWLPVRADLRGLDLRADVDEVGHWSLHGFDSGGSGDPAAALRQLQRLMRLRLLDCQLEVHDVALRGGPLLFHMRLADIEHSGTAFRFRADVEPPPSMAGVAELRGVLIGDLGQTASLDGGWTLAIRELRGWPWLTQQLADDAALKLSAARLSFDGTIRAGRVTSIEVQANAAQVAAERDAHTLAQISQFQLHSKAQPTADCWKVEISDLELDGARGHWSAGKGRYECTHDANGVAVDGRVELLRLDDLAPWLGLWKDLPASAARVHDIVGDLHDVQLSTLPPDSSDRGEPRTYVKLAARLQDGGLSAAAQQPGIAGLNGQLSADNDSGQLRVDKGALQLSLPETFEQALPVDAFSTALNWRREGRDWHLWAPQFDWQAVGTQGSGRFDLLFAANAAPRLRINAAFSSSDAMLAKPYMPLSWTPQTRAWLARALVKASVPKGSLVLEGAMQDFPFTEPGSGRWALDLELADGTLAFSPDWAPIEQLHGKLSMRGHGLSNDADRAQIGGNQIDQVRASIADFRDAQLLVDGSVHGEAARFYDVLRASPLHQRLSGLIDKTDLNGPAQLDLHLEVPLAAAEEQTHARGHVAVNKVTLKVHGLDEPIREIVGAVDFGATGVSADALNGRFYGRPLTVNIHPENGVPTGVLEAQTSLPLADDAGLAGTYVPPWLRRQLSGSANLHARLPLGGADEGRLTVSSDLRGLSSRLPPPLTKSADSALPVTVHVGSDAQTPLQLGIEVADVMRVGLRFASQESNGAGSRPTNGSRPMAVRGIEVRLDGAAIPRAQADGIVVDGAPAVLDLAPWIPFITDLGAEGNPADLSPAAGTRKSLAFVSADLRPQRLLYGDFVLLQPQLRAHPLDSGYRVELSGDSAQGTIDWSKADNGHIVARLQRLKFEAMTPHAEVPAAAGNDAPPFAPARAPTLDLTCDDLHAGAADLGHLTLTTARAADGQQVDALRLQGGEMQLDANGVWRRAAGQSSAELAFSIDSSKIGDVFSAIGYPHTIAAKQARIKAALSWPPDAAGLQWAQAVGTIDLDLHKGDLKNVDPGAGRALGLFSLYALPRRLLLDFRDVFAKGLSFDQLSGKFALGQAQARTDSLEIKSPSLRIVMHGRIGLAARDYDEHVTVYPDVTTGVTIAGALAGGPLGAAIALVAQEVLGKPFNKLSQFSYHVTGPWDNPQIKHGEANKDECPQDTPVDAKAPTDARGKACSPRVERAPRVEPGAPAAAQPNTDTAPPASSPPPPADAAAVSVEPSASSAADTVPKATQEPPP